MFSILVPIYNREVRPLAIQLLSAAERLGRPCEIVMVEDGSTEHLEANIELSAMQGIRYLAFAENAGRAAIRNTLAGMASQPFLIFLDCDVALPDADFLLRYESIQGYDVVCGGHSYAAKSPPSRRLHHQYGLRRECPAANTRNLQPFRSFKTSNFMVRKEVFAQIGFDEGISGYGHEDTLFGYQLGLHSMRILHIDNPVIHLALEANGVFLEKTKHALGNALELVKSNRLPPEQIRAIEAYYRLKDNAAGRALLEWIVRIEPNLREQVSSPRPRMRSFDFLKLAWLRQLDKAGAE